MQCCGRGLDHLVLVIGWIQSLGAISALCWSSSVSLVQAILRCLSPLHAAICLEHMKFKLHAGILFLVVEVTLLVIFLCCQNISVSSYVVKTLLVDSQCRFFGIL